MTAAVFDVVAHHRRRTRDAERRADHLERQRAKLERILLLALDIATACGRDCCRLELLRALEELDDHMQRPGRSVDELAQILRETAA